MPCYKILCVLRLFILVHEDIKKENDLTNRFKQDVPILPAMNISNTSLKENAIKYSQPSQ